MTENLKNNMHLGMLTWKDMKEGVPGTSVGSLTDGSV